MNAQGPEPLVTILHEQGSTECLLAEYEQTMERLLAQGIEVYSASYPGTKRIKPKKHKQNHRPNA